MAANVPVSVVIHVFAVLGALALGTAMLVRRKGTRSHKVLGWTWVMLMAVVAASTLWIPRFLAFSWIHLFTVLTAVSLPLAIYRIRTGNVQGHAGAMKGMFAGGLIVAGLFALAPGRLLGDLLWKGVWGYATH